MAIYIDVLLFTNIIINYCVLSATKKFLHLSCSEWRLILSSFVASLFSFTVFLPKATTIVSILIKIICCTTMCLIAFSYTNIKFFIKAICSSFTFTMLLFAMMILIYQWIKPKSMAIINDTIYIHINPILLILLSIAIYLCLILTQRLLRQNVESTLVNIKMQINNSDYTCIGKIDTGNSVVEPFSGSPVIIAEKSVLGEISNQKLRVIPYKVLGGDGLMYAVKADKVTIGKEEIKKDIYIGIYDGQIDPQIKAIINSQIVR